MTTKKLSVLAAAGVLLLTAACGAATGSGGGDGDGQAGGGGEDADRAPIRVGVVTPHSGPYAELAEQQLAGIQFAADQANADGGVDGRQVEVFVADSLGTTEGAIAGAERLVRQEDAAFITGTIASTVTLAVMQRLDTLDAIQFGGMSSGDNLTGEMCSPRFFRTYFSDSMQIGALQEWAPEQGVAEWESVAADYAFGIDSSEGLAAMVEDMSGTVERQLFTPLGTTDYASYINQLDGAGGLMITLGGGDAVNFLGQAISFDALSGYDLVVANAAFTQPVLDAVDDAALTGYWGLSNWGPSADNPGTAAFVAAYQDETGEVPTDMVGTGYMTMQTLFAGVTEADSVDPIAVAEALEGLTFDSIKGEVRVRAEDHQVEAPVYFGQVAETEYGWDLVIQDEVPMSRTMPDADPACVMP